MHDPTAGISRPRLLGLLAVALLVAGCSDVSEPNRVRPVAPSDAKLLGGVAADTNPSQMAVAQVVPGFGGFFLDDTGRPTVYLTNVALAPVAQQALAGFLAYTGFTAADLRVVQGSYEYSQLDAWYRLARPAAFAVDGIVLGDVDEGLNRLRFGVSSSAAESQLRGSLSLLGIPSGAIVVQQRAPIAALATLRDRGRPTTGAMQINFFPIPPYNGPGVSLICTLGFNAVRFGINSFITNSHCTNVEGGETTPTDYYQNLRSVDSTNYIGIEVDDPEWTSYLNADCPPPLACRYSDAARVEYAPGMAFALGKITKTDHLSQAYDDTITTIGGTLTIKGKRLDPIQGEVINKMGRTTGWTRGPVTGTCVDVLAAGTNHIRLCQVQVAGISDHGDSGSPVFSQGGDGGTRVTLLGILWGGSVDQSAPELVYSPMSGIEKELGVLKVN